jgi:hypothetical protein
MTHRPIALGLVSSLVLCAMAGAAAAQPPPPPPPSYPAPPPSYPPPGSYPANTYGPQPGTYPAVGVTPQVGYQTHDGFYLNISLGPGYTSMSASSGGTDVSISGGGVAFSLGIGGAVSPNLILFGHLLADGSIDPKVEIENFGSGEADGTVTVGGFGVGVAYYVMPVNVFLSGSALATQISSSDDSGDETGESELGFGLNLAAGKEWWVSDNWGIGASAQFLAARMKDKSANVGGSKPTWTSVSFGVLLSATFN